MIPFSPPRVDQKTIDSVTETLKSGWLTTGPKTRLFEERLTEYCGNQATVAVNAATSGLELMLRWFGVKEGDEVILPAYTYCATANVIEHCGAKPVFVDVDQEFRINPDLVEEAITNRTKAIMPVDIGGYPCEYKKLHEIANNASGMFRADNPIQEQLGRPLLLADAAHSVGAEYHNRKSGSLADVSVFSFHAVKNLTTGEGGAIMLNLGEPFDNEAIYKELKIKSLHGQSKDALSKMQKGNWRYDVIEAGYKCNMMDLQAAIGLVELDRYEKDTLVKRKAIFDRYTQRLKDCDWASPPVYETENCKSAYHVYLLRIRDITEVQRDDIIARIFDKDVSVNVHFQPVPMLSHYKIQGYDMAQYPVAFDNYSREISLPVYYDLTDEQVDQVLDAVIKSVEEVIG